MQSRSTGDLHQPSSRRPLEGVGRTVLKPRVLLPRPLSRGGGSPTDSSNYREGASPAGNCRNFCEGASPKSNYSEEGKIQSRSSRSSALLSLKRPAESIATPSSKSSKSIGLGLLKSPIRDSRPTSRGASPASNSDEGDEDHLFHLRSRASLKRGLPTAKERVFDPHATPSPSNRNQMTRPLVNVGTAMSSNRIQLGPLRRSQSHVGLTSTSPSAAAMILNANLRTGPGSRPLSRTDLASPGSPVHRGFGQASPQSFLQSLPCAATVTTLKDRELVEINARARMSACYEDLISFLEMHRLSGSYALALAANGFDSLEQLLQIDDDGLDLLIAQLRHCDMDAMDEILFLDALKSCRCI